MDEAKLEALIWNMLREDESDNIPGCCSVQTIDAPTAAVKSRRITTAILEVEKKEKI